MKLYKRESDGHYILQINRSRCNVIPNSTIPFLLISVGSLLLGIGVFIGYII